MYVDGCHFWENRFDTVKILLDYGGLEFECDSCTRYGNCFIQDLKTKEEEKYLKNEK